jgi:streptomycin 6-kinase
MVDDAQLDAAVAARIAEVDVRVARGGDMYQKERHEVRHAAGQVDRLRRELDLGRFVRLLGRPTGKPQLVLEFEGKNGTNVVLKVLGRPRPAEAAVERWWGMAGIRTVNVLANGDAPTSWILMSRIDGDAPSLSDLQRDWAPTTKVLARTMEAAHRLPQEAVPGSVPLADALVPHLDVVVAALRRHDYEPPAEWQEAVVSAYRGGSPVVLHGDLAASNLLRDRTDGGLWLIDSCAYLGDASFDGARWCARLADVETAEAAHRCWCRIEVPADPELATRLFGSELLMTAGVRELVKDEQQLPWDARDDTTQALLARATTLLDLR